MAITHQHILLLALLLASPTVARAAQAAEGTATVPRFEPARCPKLQGAEELAKASCFYLVVPENRGRPAGRTIRLLVAKYPARSAEKRPDPVVYLAGGPGDIVPTRKAGLGDRACHRRSEPLRHPAATPAGGARQGAGMDIARQSCCGRRGLGPWSRDRGSSRSRADDGGIRIGRPLSFAGSARGRSIENVRADVR